MLTHCPITGICIKRFLLTVSVGFIFIYAFDFVVHGILLMDIYKQTPDLWRGQDDMMAHMLYMNGMQAALAFITAFIFTRNYEAKGIAEGLRFGLMLGLLMGIMPAMSYAWMPISGLLAFAWFLTGIAQGIGLGVIYALLYRK